MESEEIYFLVCEGPSDTFVIEDIAKNISKLMKKEIKIHLLAPQRDATSREFPEHGWEEVRAWCQIHGNKSLDPTDLSMMAFVARRKNWRNQMEVVGAKGLIIHMDTDIAQYIDDISPKFTSGTKNARKKHCGKALLNWLVEKSIPEEIHFLLATHSTETWLLSTHERIEPIFSDLTPNFDFEEIVDVVDRLIQLGYHTHIDRETGRKKLTKHETIYKRYANQLTAVLPKVRNECEEVESLCKRFENK